MSRAAELKTVNCTSCGAGLSVHGGGRVLTHICDYCGAELDAQDNYKLLATFVNSDRPETPFQHGMTGTIEGVAFTVIGTLGLQEPGRRGVMETWVEHQLFSPTHGYTWMSVEDGHLVFTRKVRGLEHPDWISEGDVETSEYRPTATWRGRVFTYFETSKPEITYAAGEFNWTPKKGDTSTVISLRRGAEMLGLVDNGRERELELSSYLPQNETLAAFGAEPLKPTATHALQTLRRLPDLKFQAIVAVVGMIASVVLTFVSELHGEYILNDTAVALKKLPASVKFKVDKPDEKLTIGFSINVRNGWGGFEYELSDPDDETLASGTMDMEYYSGGSGDDAWSEGSSRGWLNFVPSKAGVYTVSMESPYGVGDRAWRGRAPTHVWVNVWDPRNQATEWIWRAFFLFLVWLIAVLGLGFYYATNPRPVGDWDDD